MQYPKKSKKLGGLARKGAAVVLSLIMVAGALPGAGAVTQQDIDNLKNQAASLNTQKSQLQSQLDELANSKNSALDQKVLLEQKIGLIQSEITVSEQAIANYGQQITVKEQELAAAQAEEEKHYQEFCQRVRTMEERGTVSYWEVLFNANSFADLLDQINVISEVMDYDNEVAAQLEAARQAVADAKASLEDSKAQEEAAKASLETQKADLQAEQATVEALIAQIQSQSDVYDQKLDALEQSSSSISNQLSQAEAQYAAQIAAQKKAEEEAARKKAEEEANKNNSSNSNNSNNSNNSSNSGSSSGSANSRGYLWPLPGYTRVSSPFGYRNCPYHGQELHTGVDLPAPGGTPILAAKSGVVIIAQYHSSYGNYVAISHSDGSRTMYCHQSRMAVSAGQTVSQGQVIGYVGTTGSSTGNHLHLELWLSSSSSSRVDPMDYCL